ncbi:MAG: sulfatase [Cyclobacteriaceae bacterium]
MKLLSKLLLHSLLIFFVFSCQAPSQEFADEKPSSLKGNRPNILFAISDDQSYPHASAYGYEAFSTPHFDRIAREGILFHRAFAPSPGCSPSRAAMLTGLQCWQLENAGTHASSFPSQYQVYPDLLEKADYFVGYTGKGWGPGKWDVSGRSRNPAGPQFSGNTHEAPEGINKTDYAANFSDFLSQRKDGQPFFFWFGASEPHRVYKKGIGAENGMDASLVKVPGFLPDVEEVRQDMLDYGYEIQWFDTQLGKMIQLLEEAGELENTLIVVTSDNGMPFPRAKANVYEYGIHMPLALRWGEAIRGGQQSDELVSLIDFFGTFLDVAGADYPDYEVESKSLLDLMQGRKEVAREAVFSSRERHSYSRWNNLGYPQRAMRTQDYLYIRNFRPERWPAGAPQKYLNDGSLEENHRAYHDIDDAAGNFVIRERDDPQYEKYFHLAVDKRPAEELYAIKTDPACLNNLAADPAYAATLREMRTKMGGYLMATDDPRVSGNGEIFESYERLSGPMRKYPLPDWAETQEQPID